MKKVTAALIIKDGKCLIAKRKANDRLGNLWEFPGGKIEEGETPEVCLKRELKEELNIDVIIGEFFAESIYKYSHATVQLLAYFVKWQEGTIQLNAHDEIAWVTKNTIENYNLAPADVPLVKRLRRYWHEF